MGAADAAGPASHWIAPEGAYSLRSSVDLHREPEALTAPNPNAPPTVIQPPPAYPAKAVALEMFWTWPTKGRPREQSAGDSVAAIAEQRAVPFQIQTSNLAASGSGELSPGSDAPSKKRTLSSLPSLGSIPISSLSASSGSSANTSAAASSRPRNAFKSTNSSFIKTSENSPPSNASLRAVLPPQQSSTVTFGFATTGRTFVWLLLDPMPPTNISGIATGLAPAIISRVIFAGIPTCVAVNPATASTDRLDVLVGFTSGDIVHLDPLTGKYSRLNKQGCVTPSAITAIKWSPYTPGQFLTSHADGTVVVWALDREDAPFTPSSAATTTHQYAAPPEDAELTEDIIVSRSAPDRKGQNRANPVSHWRVSRKSITDFAFSPDLTTCAAASEDGCLRIIDVASERLTDTYGSYFGALTCVTYSPDGRFIVTGGQDDLVSVWSPSEQRLLARAQGHSSFVTSIAFDDVRSTDRTLRFVSVSEDCRLIFWDLNRAALHRPKTGLPYQRRFSLSSTLSLTRRRTIESSVGHLPLDDGSVDSEQYVQPVLPPIFHPPLRRSEVAVLQPVTAKAVSADLLTSLIVSTSCICTVSRGGLVQVFARPPERPGGHHSHHVTSSRWR